MTARRPALEALPTRTMLIVLLAGASLAFSMAFACATPFAALAAGAVFCVTLRHASAAVALAWLVNQADGFLFMHYPRTWDSFGWGFAILVAALTATLAASAARRLALRRPPAAALGAFAAAFAAYEGVMFAARLVLPSSPEAFSPAIVERLLGINVAAGAVLMVSIGLLKRVGAALPPGVVPAHRDAAGIERPREMIL